MPNIRGPELLILVLLIVILFGAKRLPDAARSVGRSLRIFKAETRGLTDGEPGDPSAIEDTSGSGTARAAGGADQGPATSTSPGDATDVDQGPPPAPRSPRHQT